MEQLLDFVLQVAVWFIIFKVAFALLEIWLTQKQDLSEREELKNKLVKMIHYINQEKHGDCYYWFDKETDEFLAQGTTEAEIKEHLSERFKNHIFIIDDDRVMYGPKLDIVPIDQLPKVFNASTKTS